MKLLGFSFVVSGTNNYGHRDFSRTVLISFKSTIALPKTPNLIGYARKHHSHPTSPSLYALKRASHFTVESLRQR